MTQFPPFKVSETATQLASATFPAWSPGGSRIAFSLSSGGDSGLYVMNADGTGQTKLNLDGFGWMPAWSPDGNYLAVVVNDGGQFQEKSDKSPTAEIYVVAVKSGTWTRLTNDAFDDLYPSWRR